MTWIKICGITNLEDAQTAVEAGADAVGFVFHEKSPRTIDSEAVREIVSQLPTNIEKVGVFAQDADDCVAIAKHCDLTAVQVQISCRDYAAAPGNQLVAVASPNRIKVYVSWPATWLAGSAQAPDFKEPFGTIFLDSGTAQQPGGTGKVFDWARAAPMVASLRKRVNFVVAGGLTPENVVEAMGILRPWGVDVASGVEARPGKKDPRKVRAFIAAVRQADRSV